jgi:hypothetical protein
VPRIVGRLILLAVGILTGFALAEAGLRVLERVDDRNLAGRVIADPILQLRVPAGQWGHDANGFRNARVPEQAEIVVLGDSQTWGVGVRRPEAWPQELARATGRTVYNMGMIGWGPAQYWSLTPRALALGPSVLVIQLYLGNDFYDAFQATYSLDHYRSWRMADPPDAIRSARSHAVVAAHQSEYGLHPPAGGPWRRTAIGRLLLSRGDAEREFAWGAERAFPAAAVVRTERLRTLVGLAAPQSLLDEQDPAIEEGARLTFAYLDGILREIGRSRARLLVTVFPAKASSFSSALRVAHPVTAAESAARAMVRDWCARTATACVDLTPEFQAAVAAGTAIYPITLESHPTAAGHAIVAKAVGRALAARGW